MMERDYEILLISELELKILLASMGCRSVFGPFSEERQESRQEVLTAVASLLKRDQLMLIDGVLHAEPALQDMLQDIAGAAQCLVVYSETGQICCCYGEDWVTAVMPFERSEWMLRMTRLERETVAEFLEQEGFFSEPPVMLSVSEQELWEQTTSVLFTAERRRGTETEGVMQVLCAPLRGCTIRWETGGCGEEYPFDKTLWRELIEVLMIGVKKYDNRTGSPDAGLSDGNAAQ